MNADKNKTRVMKTKDFVCDIFYVEIFLTIFQKRQAKEDKSEKRGSEDGQKLGIQKT